MDPMIESESSFFFNFILLLHLFSEAGSSFDLENVCNAVNFLDNLKKFQSLNAKTKMSSLM